MGQQKRYPCSGRQPPITPCHQGQYDRIHVGALRCEHVLEPFWSGLVSAPNKQASIDQFLEAKRKQVGGDRALALNFVESARTQEERSDHHLRPTVTETVHRLAEQSRVAGTGFVECHRGTSTHPARWPFLDSCPWAVLVADVARSNNFLARLAGQPRRHRGSARSVFESLRVKESAFGPQLVEAPEHERGRIEAEPDRGEVVLRTACVLPRALLQAAEVDEPGEPIRQDVAGDPDSPAPVAEAGAAMKRCPEDEQRPSITDRGQGPVDGVGADLTRLRWRRCDWTILPILDQAVTGRPTMQSIGQAGTHCGTSNWPTHSLHRRPMMAYRRTPPTTASLGQAYWQAPQAMQS